MVEKRILILRCPDCLLWYRDLVGTTRVYLGEDAEVYWSREPAGYKNIIYKTDAVLVEQDWQPKK